MELRFIEFMPLDAEAKWESAQVLSGSAVRAVIEEAYGPLLPVADRPGRIGFINPVSEPFCNHCDRLRLTAEGQIRNCLFSTQEWDVRSLLRDQTVNDAELAKQFVTAVAEKKAGHGIDSPEFLRPERAMYQIGG